MRQFKVGDIVQNGTYVSSIKKIENEIAVLAKNYEVNLEKLTPVEIGKEFDKGIVLDCVEPMRAPIVAPGTTVPLRQPKYYLNKSINGTSMVSIIEENNLRYIHELQDWIAQNASDYVLRMRV